MKNLATLLQDDLSVQAVCVDETSGFRFHAVFKLEKDDLAFRSQKIFGLKIGLMSSR
jgi:hypothetical protein